MVTAIHTGRPSKRTSVTFHFSEFQSKWTWVMMTDYLIYGTRVILPPFLRDFSKNSKENNIYDPIM
jgi:hypothetical protein